MLIWRRRSSCRIFLVLGSMSLTPRMRICGAGGRSAAQHKHVIGVGARLAGLGGWVVQ